MLKLASLSLAALLLVVSPPVFASDLPMDGGWSLLVPVKKECFAPKSFGPDVIRIEGAKLEELRKATGLPKAVDLVLILKAAPVMIAFVKGCAVGYGNIEIAKPTVPGIEI